MISKLTALLLACVSILVAPVSKAQEPLTLQPTAHWAYASFLGTGWYKINDERSAFVLRMAPRWKVGEAGFDENGKREISYNFRVPVTLGLARFDFDDVPGILDPDNYSTASLNLGVDADIPITQRFSLQPSAELGYGTVIGESNNAWTYKAEVRSRYTFRNGNLDWSLIGALGNAGYNADIGGSDDFTFLKLGAEFAYPVNWTRSDNDQSLLYWHLDYVNFIDEIDLKTGLQQLGSVADYWQLGFALGKTNQPVRIWFLKFDRLGLAYNHSSSGELRGVSMVFRSLYNL